MTGPLPPWLAASLCGTCRHLRLVRSERGSAFALCRRAGDDPRFPRYPPQPVAACLGHQPAAPTGESTAADPDDHGRDEGPGG